MPLSRTVWHKVQSRFYRATLCLSVRLSVRLSVTRRYYTKNG